MDRTISSSYKSHSASSKPSGSTCVICFNTQSIFSVGSCDHPVCYECSTTMRVLHNQKECAICRCIMTKVIFTKELDLFNNLDGRQYSNYNKKYGIAFDDDFVEYFFKNLMRIYCKKCYNRPEFEDFEQLVCHMSKSHNMVICRLCVNHLKIFPSQRRWYKYGEFVRHRTIGDPDNTSHKGHPLCRFCNVCYFDKDELFKHLRKEHFYCSFCDDDGVQYYYKTYKNLTEHYEDKHYICIEGNCYDDQYSPVFRNEIELQEHRAEFHNREPENHGSRLRRYASMGTRTNNDFGTSQFPSLNLNQSVNIQNSNSSSALGQELAPLPKPQKPNDNQMAAAAVLQKPTEHPKPDRNRYATAGPSTSQLLNQATDFLSLNSNQQTRVKEVAASSSNSSSSWVSKAKTANVNSQEEKMKEKKEVAAANKKNTEALKVPGPSDFLNLNKKMEASMINLSKLDNKKKTDSLKKNDPVENMNNNNNNQNKNNIQTTVKNNNSKKAGDSSKSFDYNKVSNQPKLKLAEEQCNSTANSSDIAKAIMTMAKQTKINVMNNSVNTSTVPKKDLYKNKENRTVPHLENLEETSMDTNNKKDKKKQENENSEQCLSVANSAVTISCPQFQRENDSKLLHATPKIPPGFEKSFQHMVKTPPGLLADGNRPQTQIKAQPDLSLTNNYYSNSTNLSEYLYPINSTVWNPVLINNIAVAPIPEQNECYDTFVKFNNNPKMKLAEEQYNSTVNGSDIAKAIKAIAIQTKINVKNNSVNASTEQKKDLYKMKKNDSVPLLEKSVETSMDMDYQKDKMRSKKNENIKEPWSADNSTVSISCPQLQRENNSKLLQATPKIPPGFEKSFQHMIRTPPGLLADGNGPQTQMNALPDLSLTNNNYNNLTKLSKYENPIDSEYRNLGLINILKMALVPVYDVRFNTFENFINKCSLFRKNLISAYEFYLYCVEVLYQYFFDSVFRELVLLLPDIQKQQELLFIYYQICKKEMNVKVCEYCHQVLGVNDIEHHMSFHNK